MDERAAERRAGMTLVAAAQPTFTGDKAAEEDGASRVAIGAKGVAVMPKSVRREVAAESVVAVAMVGGAR